MAACAAPPGCARRPPAPPGAVWVDGTVAYDERPLPHGVVQFFATDGNASGSVRIEDGRFGGYLQPGRYAVAVVARERPAQEDDQGRYVPATSLIPERYGDIASSTLVVDVEAHRPLSITLTR